MNSYTKTLLNRSIDRLPIHWLLKELSRRNKRNVTDFLHCWEEGGAATSKEARYISTHCEWSDRRKCETVMVDTDGKTC